MPGPALHHMIANELRRSINSGQGLGTTPDYAQLQSLLADPKNLPYLFLGCQGPDFLFFNTKDWPAGPLGSGVEMYYKVYDAIDDFKKSLLALVPQPVIDAIEAAGDAADAVVSSSSTLTELQQLFSDMQAVVDALSASLIEMIKEYISDYNIYDLLGHPYRDGDEPGKWWWFDALHYRKSGRFAKALLNAAPPNSPLHLYTTGYLTHFTADTVGHPYVNINSGGPYRNQSQRHKTGENYQDVFNLLNHTTRDWNRSKLHALYNFNFTGTVSPPGDKDEIPDPNTKLPDDLAKMIADTINSMYTSGAADDNQYGRRISATDVNNSYRLWYRWLRSATDTGTLPVPVPYSLTAELEEVWDKAMDNLGSIGDFIEDAIDKAGSFNILSIFLALAALIVAAVAAVAALIDAVLGALTTLTTAGIRYAASLIYDELYNAFQNFRLGVSLNGLAFPMLEHLDEPRFRQFKNTFFNDPNGVNAGMLKSKLPKLNVKLASNSPLDDIFSREKHLVYPPVSGGDEPNPVIAAPDSYFDKTSLFYAFGDIPLDKRFIDEIAALSGDESQIRSIFQKWVRQKRQIPTLGNAMMLTEEIYDRWKKNNPVPDFNLDADRGYAYTCWTQAIGGNPESREDPEELLQHKQQENNQPITPVELQFILP